MTPQDPTAQDQPVSDQPTAERKSFTCHDCGFVWLQGEHGGHDCKTRILTRLERVRGQRDAARAELEDMQARLEKAAADMAKLRADLAAAREERDALKDQAKRALELAEWVSRANGEEQWVECPVCTGDCPDHRRGCTTAAAIAALSKI